MTRTMGSQFNKRARKPQREGNNRAYYLCRRVSKRGKNGGGENSINGAEERERIGEGVSRGGIRPNRYCWRLGIWRDNRPYH